jgi:hypothetical protein
MAGFHPKRTSDVDPKRTLAKYLFATHSYQSNRRRRLRDWSLSATFPRVNVAITIVICALVVIGCDWVAAGRLASTAPSFDYRYWPPSKWRIFSLVLVSIATSVIILSPAPDPQKPLDGPLGFFFIAVIVWGLVTWLDFMRQRRDGYRQPLRYSDPDD